MAKQTELEFSERLRRATLKAREKVVGIENVREAHHALLVATAIEAFGDSPTTTFYIEIRSTAGNIPRPDLILLHPELGVVVIENKGVSLADIHDVEGTMLRLMRGGQLRREDPFHQAERVSFRLRDLVAARHDPTKILFLHTAALPRIGREEFTERFKTQLPDETLFRDECHDPKSFKRHVAKFAEVTQNKTRKAERLSLRASDAITMILTGKSFVYAPRPRHIIETDKSLIGVQIQEMELALKDATHQQKELGKADLRGHHRLFRGVAGSGKSIMLALSVSHAMLKYREEEIDLFGKRPRKSRVLVVCFNRTLVPYLKQRVEDRFGRLAWDKPGEDELLIRHFEGLMRHLKATIPTMQTDLDFRQKAKRAKALCDALDRLSPEDRERIQFDAVYVDEAQDLVQEEFALLQRLARKDKAGGQTFVLFYDNAQNIYGVPTPVWSQIGINIVGRTVFLDQCLRNTAQVLLFAFNVLVGSHASEGTRVTMKQFADVESLRSRALVEEVNGWFDVKFAPRAGPVPVVRTFPDRNAEIEGVAAMIRRLIDHHKVLPSDILVLFNSHQEYGDSLESKLQEVVGTDAKIRFVDSSHRDNKSLPLIEDGVLTVSTVASAKGYDAPVVFLLGADKLRPERNEDRATFYVGATRAKLNLIVTGVQNPSASLLVEAQRVLQAMKSVSGESVPPTTSTDIKPETSESKKVPPSMSQVEGAACAHCKGKSLHAQHGKFGYFFRCITCTENTPMALTCSRCRSKAKIRKSANDFFRECPTCGLSELYHLNVRLDV